MGEHRGKVFSSGGDHDELVSLKQLIEYEYEKSKFNSA